MRRILLEAICMDEDDFVKEHRNLLNVLRHPTKQKLRKEAKSQGEELREKMKKRRKKNAA